MEDILAFIPGLKFPDVSITGSICPLGCKYCKGYYLRNMEPTLTPKKLYDTAKFLAKRGAKGLLISGGFNLDGRLPIEPFLSAIKDIKRDFNLVISVHSGLVDKSLAIKLREAGVDIVDYEIIIDDYVIKEIMNLKSKGSADFIKSFEILEAYGPPYIAPHVPIGLNYGKVVKEYEAVDVISQFKPYILIFLVFIPTKGTDMENVRPPSVTEIINVIRYGNLKVRSEIALGCMRPWFMKFILDPLVYKLKLVSRIVNPPKLMIRKYGIKVIEACCSIPRELFDIFIE